MTNYFSFSTAIHVAIAIGSLYLAIPALENLKKDEVVIELIELEAIPPVVKSLETPKGELVKETKGAPAVRAPAPSAPVESEVAEVIKAPVQKSSTSTNAKIAKMKTFTGGGEKVIAKAAPSRAGVAETIEDIPAPTLDFDGVAAAQAGNLGDDAFENEFKNIDRSNAAAIQAQQSELDNEAKIISDEQDAALKALENDNKAKARAMEDALAATRTKNAAALAQMIAAEQAASEKAAKDATLIEQANARAQANAAAQRGQGAGDSGSEQASGTEAGDPDSVRTLDQLKQVPGNPKPQYSNDERLRREQGMVAFHAYISKTGKPTEFRIMKSTGFRNLDGKTLAALKRWKFYPGQEGWVEIPFKWDIKGGVQEMPTLLRRYGSR